MRCLVYSAKNKLLESLLAKLQDEGFDPKLCDKIDESTNDSNFPVQQGYDCAIIYDLDCIHLFDDCKEARELLSYKYILENCIKIRIKRIHIIQDASKLYKGFIKPYSKYKYSEENDKIVIDSTSLANTYLNNFLFYESKKHSVIFTISRYNKIYEDIIFKIDYQIKLFNKYEYTEDNEIRDYSSINDIIEKIIIILISFSSCKYNLPPSFYSTLTGVILKGIDESKIDSDKIYCLNTHKQETFYVLDSSKYLQEKD